MPQNHTRILRLFGPTVQELTPLLKAAAAQGCPGLRLVQKQGESLVSITAPGPGPEDAQTADRWAEQLKEKLGASCFGEGDITLAGAAVEALAQKGKLVVAANEAAGLLLNAKLEQEPAAGSVYDFGQYSWADPRKAEKLKARHGHTGLAAAVDEARAALKLTGADYALSLVEEEEGRALLLCTPAAGYLRRLEGESGPVAAGWMLDMARRLALGLEQSGRVESFGLKGTLPGLAAAPAEESEPAPQPEEGKEPDLVSRPAEDQQVFRAAWNLYSDQLGGEEPETFMPEPEPKKKNYLGRILACLLLVALVAGGVVALRHKSQSLGDVPIFRGYGTAGFDQEARDYLTQAMEKNGTVEAFLAFSGQPGTLLFGPQPEEAPAGAVFADGEASAAPAAGTAGFAGTARPGRPHSNLLIQCPAAAVANLGRLNERDVLKANYGFTLYDAAGTWRYKVVSVFYWDPAETGEGAFDLTAYQDLTNYRDHLNFVVGIKARSLYDLPVAIEDGDSFATLITDAAATGQKLVVTGRLIRAGETASVNLAEITAAGQPLLPRATCLELGAESPTVADSSQYWLNWYRTGNETAAQTQEALEMPEEDMTLEELWAALEEAKNMGQQLENAMLSLAPMLTHTPTPVPSATPTPAPSGAPSATPTPEQTATPTPT
ncbi:MAG: hypothetical protein IIV90_01415, partial [Oscillospiraceae bacterium]|nr:hypothetical protein [Oscillospiraceae bacterium]